MNFLSVNADAKTIKGTKRGYLTGVLYLAPHKLSGRNLCPNASPGCIDTCLNTAGRGAFNSVQKARIAKTHKFTSDQYGFLRELSKDIDTLRRKAKRDGMIPLIRLNGTSDIPWENVLYPVSGRNLMREHYDIQFYDYTKSPGRMSAFLDKRMPPNYHLTFSRSECNDADALAVLEAGGNVAVVFSTKRGTKLPKTWSNFKVIDGDRDDIRHRDNVHSANGASSIQHRGVVIGLRAKGKARKDTSGFVVQV
jgi:hypothetical protein